MSNETQRRSAYKQVAGTVLAGASLLFGATFIVWGFAVLNSGNEPQGRLVTGVGIVLFAVGAIATAARVVGRVRRRYP